MRVPALTHQGTLDAFSLDDRVSTRRVGTNDDLLREATALLMILVVGTASPCAPAGSSDREALGRCGGSPRLSHAVATLGANGYRRAGSA